MIEFFDRVHPYIDLRGILLLALVFIPIERLVALHKDQRIFRRWWWNDLTHLILNRFFIGAGLVVLMTGATVIGRLLVPAGVRAAVAAQPLWLQVIEAIVLADLGFYTAHRLFHVIPVLWKFHAIHHSIEEMDWLAGARVHPIDQVITKGMSLLPLFALGFSTTAVVIFSWIYLFHSFLLHANVRLNFGPLRWLIASPHFHHWHHANEPAAHNKNYAGQLSILDKIFGTMHMPDGEEPASFGIEDPVPKTYVAHLVYPFMPTKSGASESAGDETTDGSEATVEVDKAPRGRELEAETCADSQPSGAAVPSIR